MLNEAKTTCRALDPHYAPELCRLISAAIIELKTRGILFGGTFEYSIELEESTGMPIVSAWSCTITDAWVRTAVLAYVKAHFPGMKDAEKYMEAYERILGSMMNTTGYTMWEGGEQ